jgi:K+-sensing histidine kinase KdpD
MSDATPSEAIGRDCLRMLAHDLGSPLTAIRVLAELLGEDASNDESRQDATDVVEAADLAAALVEGMSSLLKLGVHEDLTWFPIDLVQVLRLTVDRPALARRVRLNMPRELSLNGDRRALQRALTDVLVSGLRLVPSEEMLSLTIEATEEGATITVVHCNIGVGADELREVFDPAGAIALRRRRVPVAATGLAYAASVFKSHGGGMEFSDVVGGVALVVTLRN